MLEADTRKRLGCGLRPGVQELETIRAHQWFEGFDFTALDRKELASGFIPDVSPRMPGALLDLTLVPKPEKSVDPMFAIAESMIGPTYLKARKWDPKQDTSKMSYEMRTLHERFMPFDYERPGHFVLSFNTRPTPSLSSASSHTLSDSASGPSTPSSGESIGQFASALCFQPLLTLQLSRRTVLALSQGRFSSARRSTTSTGVAVVRLTPKNTSHLA